MKIKPFLLKQTIHFYDYRAERTRSIMVICGMIDIKVPSKGRKFGSWKV